MSIPQQILRIPHSPLESCSINPDQLAPLIAFRLTIPEQGIDLNWAPLSIQQSIEKSKQFDSVQEACRFY